jgi:hypothetical protein
VLKVELRRLGTERGGDCRHRAAIEDDRELVYGEAIGRLKAQARWSGGCSPRLGSAMADGESAPVSITLSDRHSLPPARHLAGSACLPLAVTEGVELDERAGADPQLHLLRAKWGDAVRQVALMFIKTNRRPPATMAQPVSASHF